MLEKLGVPSELHDECYSLKWSRPKFQSKLAGSLNLFCSMTVSLSEEASTNVNISSIVAPQQVYDKPVCFNSTPQKHLTITTYKLLSPPFHTDPHSVAGTDNMESACLHCKLSVDGATRGRKCRQCFLQCS